MDETESRRIAWEAFVNELASGKDEPMAYRAARAKWPGFCPEGIAHDTRAAAYALAQRIRDRK